MSAIQVAGVDKLPFVSREVNRWMNRVLGGYHRYPSREAWAPPVNLYEDALAYYLVADMAGVEPGVIDLHLNGRQLVLRGDRPTPRLDATIAQAFEWSAPADGAEEIPAVPRAHP